MAQRSFTTGTTNWIPSADGVTNGTPVLFRVIANGSSGIPGTPITGGAGCGGGGYADVTVVIADATLTYQVVVRPSGSVSASTVSDPTLTVIASANPGTMAGGGAGTVGDTLRTGGAPGAAGTDSGGGGGGAAGDASAGNAGTAGSGTTGGTGGAGVTQFGNNITPSGAGGNGGSTGNPGGNGSSVGGGGGGGARNQSGGTGSAGGGIATWSSEAAVTASKGWPMFYPS